MFAIANRISRQNVPPGLVSPRSVGTALPGPVGTALPGPGEAPPACFTVSAWLTISEAVTPSIVKPACFGERIRQNAGSFHFAATR
jgi:hypothetical protein